eukprot:483183_1
MVQNNSFGTHHSMLLLKQQQEVKEEEKDQRIEVLVPPGKLGVVLYTKPLTNAIPEIWSINESSILAETVKVGDRIIAVDDQDTCHTSMDADNVSELINEKKKDARCTSTNTYLPTPATTRKSDSQRWKPSTTWRHGWNVCRLKRVFKTWVWTECQKKRNTK